MPAGSSPRCRSWRCSATTIITPAGRDDVIATLRDAGVVVLERDHLVLEVGGLEVGVAGTKGFVGGFPGAEIADFGEALLREVYAETSREVDALEKGLEAISGCHRRLVLLHYAPLSDTLTGEPEGIWAFLGSGRLAGAHRRPPAGRGVPRPRAPRQAARRDRRGTGLERRPPRDGRGLRDRRGLAGGPAAEAQAAARERRMRQERRRLSSAASSSPRPRAETTRSRRSRKCSSVRPSRHCSITAGLT